MATAAKRAAPAATIKAVPKPLPKKEAKAAVVAAKAKPAARRAAEAPAPKRAVEPAKTAAPKAVRKKAAAVPVAPKKQATVTFKAIASNLLESLNLPKKECVAMVDAVLEAAYERVKDGDKVRMGNLGTLSIRRRTARTGRNPATGETIGIPASAKVAFSASKELKALV